MTNEMHAATYASNYAPENTRKAGKPAVFIGKCPCKGCATVKTVHLDTVLRATSKNANWVPGVNNPPHYVTIWKRDVIGYTPEVYCTKHRRLLAFREVDGSFSPDHVCDSRCTSAKGHTCDCSCGGANHGKDWM